MTSKKRLRANRANAHASTGPKSALGKARASRNARKHGLSIPIGSDPSFSQQATHLVITLGGEGATPEIQALLNRFVEAQLDLNRVRRTRYDLVAKTFDNPNFEPRQSIMRRSRLLHVLCKNIASATDEDLRRVKKPMLEGDAKYIAIVTEYRKALAALVRYERRARSRRKFAVRALDTAGYRWPKCLEGDLLKLIQN